MPKHTDADKKALAETLFGEARGESEEGQIGVAGVILNRAEANKDYWGGSQVKDVCEKPGQFECFQDRDKLRKDIENEQATYAKMERLSDDILSGRETRNPVGNSDHYNNPDKEGYPDHLKNCDKTVKIGGHQFYKGK
ncbi:unnamed protein product [Oppiella nova]|uniref:Cell wall hydrolase SleB domain-containing protein n=1 Tax=Oppiella nova TaxID=334625 RepID=A0A7R9QLK1_9ACAR|nr:unnamed protein product [Oppiella nova]CAG2168292.1 unnamed protein product [Oppiella nova]